LDDYQKWLLEQSREAAKAQRNGGSNKSAAVKGKGKAPKKNDARNPPSPSRQQVEEQAKLLRKEVTSIDNRLGVLLAERDALESRLADASRTPAEMADGGKRLKFVGNEIEKLEARWLDLGTQIDEMTATAD